MDRRCGRCWGKFKLLTVHGAGEVARHYQGECDRSFILLSDIQVRDRRSTKGYVQRSKPAEVSRTPERLAGKLIVVRIS